jgi:transcriptional regulator
VYQPPHFVEDRLEVLHALIIANPLGLLISQGSHGLSADPVPFVLDPDRGPLGTLRAHIARANRLWQAQDPESEVLIVFQGPQHYVSPGWYPTKQETGKVVPTWNYVTVHAYGRLTVIEDPDWLKAQIEALSQKQEQDQAQPWSVDDAPDAYIAAQMRAIIGLEICIDRMIGKVKVSQNRAAADRRGVAQGLDATDTDAAQAMAKWVRQYGQV